MQWVRKPIGHFGNGTISGNPVPCDCFDVKTEIWPKILDFGGRKHLPSQCGFLKARRAIPRLSYPEDIEWAVAFFASPDSDFITGQMLLVNGGEIMY